MKKNTLKIIILIILSIVFIFIFNHNSFADVINPDNYKPNSFDDPSNANKLKDIGNDIIGFLQIVGSILSVIVLGVLGIKYMIGSAEEKAEYKKTMMPYLIGAIMVFAITNIVGFISSIATGLIQT